MNEASNSPSTTVGANNKTGTSGQKHTMSGSAGGPARPSPNMDMDSAKRITIDPMSTQGYKPCSK